ncbi:MAG: DUF4412 domain-containing protein [Candidatus Omnitrophota bacterium]|jgi:hypothetical protein
MRYGKIKIMYLSLILGVAFISQAYASDFSADMVSTTNEGTFKGKIYVSKDRVRMEVPQSITITRMDKKVLWILMPSNKMYMEQPFDPRNIVVATEKMPGEIERKLLGKESVNGVVADKYSVTAEVDGMRESVFQWIEPASKVPIKTMAQDGSWTMEYQNMKMGPSPDSMFEVPPEYQKINMPVGMEDMPHYAGEE